MKTFPSPLGVSYFQIRKEKPSYALDIEFPSPLGVSYFQIGNKMVIKNEKANCFRPLSGYLISKL